MYVPKAFAMSESEMMEFVERNSFGLLVSQTDGEPLATHLPMQPDWTAAPPALYTHLARANPQWRSLDGQTVLAVFSGPHAYISPSWYGIPESVPTWDYVAVHVYGTCRMLADDAELAGMLERTVRFYEPESTVAHDTDEPYFRSMMRGVVGFRIDVVRMEGAKKLGQNKPPEAQARVAAKLRLSSDPGARAVADLMHSGEQ